MRAHESLRRLTSASFVCVCSQTSPHCHPHEIQAGLSHKIERIMATKRRQEADRAKLQSLMDMGPISRQAAAAALKACRGDFLAAAEHAMVPTLAAVERAVGLPNRCNDCFWWPSTSTVHPSPRRPPCPTSGRQTH